jgi:peptide-methionine (S)-S-oxide reductase
MPDQLEKATLGGGCFWCLDAVFRRLRGVHDVASGYAGGQVDNPSYQLVCTGTTGHAEVVQVTFDPAILTYRDVLEVFFTIHDPTTLNRQGADVGTQYRSAIFYHDEVQRKTAEEVIAALERDGVWMGIITEVSPAPVFFPAEEYHQDYYRRNPNQMYCQLVIDPKVVKLRERHRDKLAGAEAAG